MATTNKIEALPAVAERADRTVYTTH